MKKHYYIYIIALLALVAVLPVSARAEDGADDAMTPPPVPQDVQPPAPGTPPVQRPGMPVPAMLREQLRGGKTENIQNNMGIRNKLLGAATSTRPGLRMMASSTRAERRDIREDRRDEVGDIRRDGREDMRNATNTMERREIRRDMRADIFKVRKDALVKQLTVSIENLKQIRDRIASRIEKATSAGRDMTSAKSALVTADAKIQTAISAIEAVKTYVAPAPTASSTDQSVELAKPRQIGDAAIKAVKDAHEALVAVVRAIAHAMGLGDSATTTPPVTTPTTP